MILNLFEKLSYTNSEYIQARERVKQSIKVCLQQHVSYRAAWLASYYTTTAPTTTNNTTANNTTNNTTTGEANNSDSMVIESSPSPSPTLPIGNDEVKEVERVVEQEEEEEEYMGCKYLTSPSLFQLQLSDPNLRQEIITQIIIFLHHFSRRLPFILETAVSASSATIASGTSGSNVVSIKGKGTQATSRLATTSAAAVASTTTTTTTATTGRGAKGSTTTTTSSAAAASKTEVIPTPTTPTPTTLTPIEIAVKNIRHDIALIRKKAYQQLSVTPPNGSELLPFLQRLLEREEHWIAWKKTSCTDFERPPTTLPILTTSTSADTIITAMGGKKDSIVAKSAIYVR